MKPGDAIRTIQVPAANKPLRILCLDGGGMRGIYTAAYLHELAVAYAKKLGVEALDVGIAFDLIAGTSTGAIIACALAAGVPLDEVVGLYRRHGKAIFPRRLPSKLNFHLLFDLFLRRRALRKGEEALCAALKGCFGDVTLGSVYDERGVALAIPAVDIETHRSWVFKTPHLPNSGRRDDAYTLVDVCRATTAAPLFRSLAVVTPPGATGGRAIFADGGLWANNPVLVGLIDALEMAGPDRPVEIFCLGTCSRPAGDDLTGFRADRGLLDWRFGGEAAKLAIDAQEFAYDQMARMFSRHLDRPCEIIRFPRHPVPAALMKYLDLDDASDEALTALVAHGRKDAQMTNGRCGDPKDREGCLVDRLFRGMPPTVAKETAHVASPENEAATTAPSSM